MSSGEKLAKGKSKKAAPKAKTVKGKEVPVNDHRFRGEGVKFKCKLVGSADVSNARGDAMCAEAIKKLKVHAIKLNKESGEHKQRIVLNVTLKGIKIIDEKTQKAQYEHPINKISFITHDPEDKKIFGYVCSQPCSTGHKLFAIKSDKPAGVVTGALYELFQVVFQLRQQAGLAKKKVPNSAQVSNGPSPQESDGIYEVPFKNGNSKNATASPQDQHYDMPVTPTTKRDPHYKVPKNQPVQATLPPLPGENNKDSEAGEKTTQAHVSNSSNLLSPSPMDKDPDQVSQASIEVPMTHDSSSTDMAFFSPSVFESAPDESGAADTVSVASADMSVIRSSSVSSGSSETHSQDTRSAHSRSSSLLNQNPATEGFQAEFAAVFDDDNAAGSSLGGKAEQEDEKTLESANQADISTAIVPQSDANMEAMFKVPPVSETSAGIESNSDPFAPSDIATSLDERTDPGTEESFFTPSFPAFDASFSNLEVKGDENSGRKDEPSDDPFASSVNAQATNTFEGVEGFVSDTSFETAFGSEQFTPSKDSSAGEKDNAQEGSEDAKTVEPAGLPQSAENSAVSFTWENTFEETKAASQPEATQRVATSESQFSWTESFTSEDIETSAAGPKSTASVSWDDAFGGAVAADKESSSQGPDAFSWDDAFGVMAGDSNNSQFDSSDFGDAFSPTSIVESSNEVSGVSSTYGVQLVSQDTEPKNPQLNEMPSTLEEKTQAPADPQLFDDRAFTPLSSSQFEESITDAQNAEVSPDPPALSKDPFEELGTSFLVPPSSSGKIDLEETKESSDSVVHNANEDIVFTEEVSSGFPSGEVAKETKAEEMDEIITHSEEQSPSSDAVDKQKVEENSDITPSELVIQDSKPTFSERPISPTVPPPLPPRPVAAAPPLPARPSSSSSTISTGMSPIGSQTSTGSPSSNSPRQGKKGQGSAKKPPPALPPRTDLNENSKNVSSNETVAFPDPFGVDFDQKFDNSKGVAEDSNSNWAASWPNSQKTTSEGKSKDFSDPFSDEFFTNFDFPQRSASDTSKSDNLDPFAPTNQPSELFPSAFGNQDLFVAFTPAKGNGIFDSGDPFKNDLSDSFAAFSSDDPFSDISDPFADKGVLIDDPFGDIPRKAQAGKALTLSESLGTSDEGDSFA